MNDELETEEENEDVSLHDALSAAIDGAEETGRPEAVPEEPVGAAPAQAEGQDPASAPAESAADQVAAAAEAGQAGSETEQSATGSDTPEGTEQSGNEKPPQSWKPVAREEWAKLPPTVKAEVQRREHEIQNTLNQTTQDRQVAQAFEQVWRPYEAFIKAENSNPIQAAEHLFRSAAVLRVGSPTEKASTVARMCQQYGVDLKSLDLALSASMSGNGGNPPPQQGYQQNQPPPVMRDPRVDQILAQQTQQVQQTALSEVESFGSDKPFFDDVRDEMADMMEISARRGVSLSLDDAYNRTIAVHPELQEILKQREAATAAQTKSAATVRARRAASSVKSHPTGGQAPQTGSMSMRESIEAALSASE